MAKCIVIKIECAAGGGVSVKKSSTSSGRKTGLKKKKRKTVKKTTRISGKAQTSAQLKRTAAALQRLRYTT